RESARPSPFEADRARKTQPEEASSPDMADGAHPFATSKMGTAAAADNGATSAALAEPANEAAVPAVAPDEVRDHALTALEDAGEETATPAATRPRPAATGTAHSRAAEDPVVRRMQEKFGAEIRSVIDQRSKR